MGSVTMGFYSDRQKLGYGARITIAIRQRPHVCNVQCLKPGPTGVAFCATSNLRGAAASGCGLGLCPEAPRNLLHSCMQRLANLKPEDLNLDPQNNPGREANRTPRIGMLA